MNLEQQEIQLFNEYNSSPANLHKLMNHSNLQALLQLGDKSTNTTTLQIIGTLIATYVEYNYQDIKDYQRIYDFAWQTINRIETDVFAVYHFFGSILANILFYYYNQIECDQFQKRLLDALSNKGVVGFIILEQIMKKFRPPHSIHKEDIQTYDSQHRSVKNLFYKDHLQGLLHIVQIVLNDQKLDYLVDPAIEFFANLIETEFVTDSKEKDWHMLKKVEVKNNRGLQTLLKEFKQSIIEFNLQQIMISNSALEFLDPTRSEIKKIWLQINNFQFLQLLLNKISQHPKLFVVLGKVCKIFKKHFKKEEQTIVTIRSITQYMSQIDLNQVNQALYLKCASRTLFINTQQEWININLQLALNAQTYYHMLQGLKFARQLARILRPLDCSNFHQIGMPIINQYFYKWALNTQAWCKDQEVLKNVKYQVRVIATHMITNYLNFFAEIMQTNQDQHIILVAFEYYLLGLTSSFRAAYYQSSVLSRYQRHPTDELLYPIDLKAFEIWNYQEFFSQAILFGLKYAIMYEQSTKRTHNFFYFIWKLFFKDTEFNEPYLLKNIDLTELFNFKRALTFEDDKFKIKALKIIKQCKLSFRDGEIQICKVILPPQCFLIFQQNNQFENYEIDRLFYSIKTKIKNLESQIQYDYMKQMLVVTQFVDEVMQQIASMQQIEWKIQLLKSIFKEANENCYHEFLARLHNANYCEVFNQFNVKLIGFLNIMINPKFVSSLSREITEGFYNKIYSLTDYFVSAIKQNYIYIQQERQIGGESQKTIYEQFYHPIIKLLKLYTKLQCLNKSSATNISKIKQKIYSYIFEILNMINQNDVLNYIHKMKPLFEICQTLISFEIPRKMLDDCTISRILLLYDLALQRQDQNTFSIVLNSILEIVNQHNFIIQRFGVSLLQYALGGNVLFN